MLASFAAVVLAFGWNAPATSVRLASINASPETVVERMLQLGHLQAGEKMCDLGSGDGRIVIIAAQEFHANATGIEIDESMFRQSVERLRSLGLARTARIVHGDLQKQRYSGYDLLTVFLSPEANSQIEPMLNRELKKSSRVVSLDYPFPGWRPTQIETVDDGSGKNRVLYLYER